MLQRQPALERMIDGFGGTATDSDGALSHQ
jgi:hypothetical protein